MDWVNMKMIMAIIKPSKLDQVKDALSDLGQGGMTVTEVRGYGRQKGQTAIYRGAEYAVFFIPKIKIEIAVDENTADRAIEAIAKAAYTGTIGDGKIFVFDLNESIRIRTGESGVSAL